MIQFTEKEISEIRNRAGKHPELLNSLKKETEDILQEELQIPDKGIGNWGLYYYCPDCSVKLIFDRKDKKNHRCPSCGRILTGEPYDSTWWGLMNSYNYNMSFDLAILYLLTGEKRYGERAVEIMRGYAEYYPGYAVHGDIPYNGPGKANAQTLDEAIFLRTYAMVFDLTEEIMSEEDKILVRNRMLLPGADFLMQHRHPQIHNHEVIIDSAIAVIGILFDRIEYIKPAVYGKYGLVYQLEQGMLPYGMWFEGSFGYHFFALKSFYAYEKFAIHTKYSNISHPNYRRMMEILVHYILPDNRIPLLNDTTSDHEVSSLYLYEFAFSHFKSKAMLSILNKLYLGQERNNMEALLYGEDVLGKVTDDVKQECYHTPLHGPGHTIFRGENDRYLLFKHDPYGGEHDHYDRLDLSYTAFGKKLASDLGTTGYGAKLHYDYYKNTGSHNTVVIGEENQSPAACSLERYEERDGILYAEAVCSWDGKFQMPDTFTIVQWKEENYRNVCMKRKIAWAGRWFAEVFLTDGVSPSLSTDWVWHMDGKPAMDGERRPVENFSKKKPFSHLSEVQRLTPDRTDGSFGISYTSDDVVTDIYGAETGQEIFTAVGPDNPSDRNISYLIERTHSGKSVFMHVVESYRGSRTIQKVLFRPAEQIIEVTDDRGTHELRFS
jgi:hypothetical protein